MYRDFETLYEKFYSQVYNYVFYRILNKEITEDLVGDIFLKIVSKYNGYDESRSKLSTWIFTIARNTVIDFYRRESPIQLDDKQIEAMINVEDKNILKLKEDRDGIICVLKKLNQLDRTVIVLKYFSDMTYKQISEHVGYSPKHVGIILNRALKKFRKIHEKM